MKYKNRLRKATKLITDIKDWTKPRKNECHNPSRKKTRTDTKHVTALSFLDWKVCNLSQVNTCEGFFLPSFLPLSARNRFRTILCKSWAHNTGRWKPVKLKVTGGQREENFHENVTNLYLQEKKNSTVTMSESCHMLFVLTATNPQTFNKKTQAI